MDIHELVKQSHLVQFNVITRQTVLHLANGSNLTVTINDRRSIEYVLRFIHRNFSNLHNNIMSSKVLS